MVEGAEEPLEPLEVLKRAEGNERGARPCGCQAVQRGKRAREDSQASRRRSERWRLLTRTVPDRAVA
jgi:hypothetical protein